MDWALHIARCGEVKTNKQEEYHDVSRVRGDSFRDGVHFSGCCRCRRRRRVYVYVYDNSERWIETF